MRFRGKLYLFLGLFLNISLSYNLLAQQIEKIADFESQRFRTQKHNSAGVGSEIDVKYHRLKIKIDPSKQFIEGSVRTDFLIAKNTDSIHFDFADPMTVDSIIHNANTLLFLHQNNILSIPFNKGLGHRDSVFIYFQGAPISTGLGSFRTSSHNGSPILSTLSEPFGARDWWPCKQDLNDKIDSIDIIINTDTSYLAASNGLLISQNMGDSGSWDHHWRHQYPIAAYLVAISVTNYEAYSDFVVSQNGDSLEVLNYVYPESKAVWQEDSKVIKDVLNLFDSLFGSYPFYKEKYGHAEWNYGGGMEHQTMSFMGNMSFALLAHELAHQWFGNKITCASWKDLWLNEGFATYVTALNYENGIGPENWKNWLATAINLVTMSKEGSVFASDTSDVRELFDNRLRYNKGALLLHMLRYRLGDKNFFKGIHNYINDSTLVYNYAKTDDLKRHLENTSELSLDEFFNDWFYGVGHPKYDVLLNKLEENTYKLTIEQSPSHPSVSFFEMPVQIKFIGETLDSLITFDHQFDGQQWDVKLPFEVRGIVFDPELWLCAEASTLIQLVAALNSNDVAIWPNPVKSELQIAAKNRILDFGMTDMAGRSVDVETLSNTINAITIDVQSLTSGQYVVWVLFGQQKFSKQIFVE